MIVTVIYYEENSKAPRLKTFSDIEKAKEWLSDPKSLTYDKQNARIMVDYGAIEAYQEMYELMRDRVFGKASSDISDRKEI